MYFTNLQVARALKTNNMQKPASVSDEDFLTRIELDDKTFVLHMGVNQVDYVLSTSTVPINAVYPVIYVTAFNEMCVNAVYETLNSFCIHSEEDDNGESLRDYMQCVMTDLLNAPTHEVARACASALSVARLR